MATLNANTYQDLSQAQEQHLRQIDQCAEEARSKLSTSGTSQARVYEAKLKEAQDGGGPILDAEAGALGIAQEEVIQSVLQAYQVWKVSCGVIEGLRLKAKSDIRLSQSPAEMYGIVKKFKEVFNVV